MKWDSATERVENIATQGENASNQHFVLLQWCLKNFLPQGQIDICCNRERGGAPGTLEKK